MSKRFHIVAKAKLNKKKKAEQAEKDGKRPKLPWKKASDSAGQSLGAITEMSFKDYLKEAKYSDTSPKCAIITLEIEHTDNNKYEVIPDVTIDDADRAKKYWLQYMDEVNPKNIVTYIRNTFREWIKESGQTDFSHDLSWEVLEDQIRKFVRLIPKPARFFIEEDPNLIIIAMPAATLNEARYYKAPDDWQEDIDENGSSIGVCPKCRGEARYETDHHPRGGMWSHWVCQNEQCGYEER